MERSHPAAGEDGASRLRVGREAAGIITAEGDKMTDRSESERRESDDEPVPVIEAATARLRVCVDRCSTCIFRPGNLMMLPPGRVRRMVQDCVSAEEHIVCHQTLDGALPGAVCAGFAQHPAGAASSLALRLARSVGRVTWVDTQTGVLTDSDEYDGTHPRETRDLHTDDA